jgi:hypothetical protein
MQFLKHILTESDNSTYDVGRVLWAVGVLVFLFLTVYCTVKHDEPSFDAQAFGIGFAAVLAAGGGMVAWMRSPHDTGKSGNG